MREGVKVTPNVKIAIIQSTIFVRIRSSSQIEWKHVMPRRRGHGIMREADSTPERRFETKRRLTSKME